MTPVEFLAPVKNGGYRELVLAAMLHANVYDLTKQLSPSQIKERLRSARVPKLARINVSDVLARAGEYVHCVGNGMWALTESGQKHTRTLLNLPESDIEKAKDVTTLAKAAGQISNDDVRDYMEEAVRCMKVDARRACIVFAWNAAVTVIHEKLLATGTTALNAAIQKHDPRARQVNSLSDFAYVKDKVALLAALELGILDKSQKDTLEEALNLRNRCGHPGKYRPSEKKVASFIEDLVSIVF